ncbi:MAG: DUF1552 domain-containing protein [Myxococcales bacterium]|nr:DUF1552 domain-containing protein [Myxococcales bacterium]
MSKHSSEVSRRLVLKSSLATVTLPFFVSLRPRELRAAASPVRLMLWFQPDGTMEKSDYKPSVEPFWPSGSTTDFKFAKTTAPLDEIKQHLVVVKGIDLTQTKTAGSIHGTRMINVLTAGAGTSADQAMADKLNGKTKFASLELGVAPDAGGNDKSRFSYRNNSAVSPEGNPSSSTRGSSGATSPRPAEALLTWAATAARPARQPDGSHDAGGQTVGKPDVAAEIGA